MKKIALSKDNVNWQSTVISDEAYASLRRLLEEKGINGDKWAAHELTKFDARISKRICTAIHAIEKNENVSEEARVEALQNVIQIAAFAMARLDAVHEQWCKENNESYMPLFGHDVYVKKVQGDGRVPPLLDQTN